MCNETAASSMLKCDEKLVKGLTTKLIDFVAARQPKLSSVNIQPAILFLSLQKKVDAAEVSNIKNKTHDSSPEIKETLRKQSI